MTHETRKHIRPVASGLLPEYVWSTCSCGWRSEESRDEVTADRDAAVHRVKMRLLDKPLSA